MIFHCMFQKHFLPQRFFSPRLFFCLHVWYIKDLCVFWFYEIKALTGGLTSGGGGEERRSKIGHCSTAEIPLPKSVLQKQFENDPSALHFYQFRNPKNNYCPPLRCWNTKANKRGWETSSLGLSKLAFHSKGKRKTDHILPALLLIDLSGLL